MCLSMCCHSVFRFGSPSVQPPSQPSPSRTHFNAPPHGQSQLDQRLPPAGAPPPPPGTKIISLNEVRKK